MTKDPICGMDVQERDARHVLEVEQETYYFCSNQCKEKYAQRYGIKIRVRRKGVWTRFLEKLAKENEDSFGGSPPTCH